MIKQGTFFLGLNMHHLEFECANLHTFGVFKKAQIGAFLGAVNARIRGIFGFSESVASRLASNEESLRLRQDSRASQHC